jgi:quercetin dioxygenase-like cupin family protein
MVKNIDTFKKEKIAAGKDTFMQVLISADEAPNFAMRRFTIEPGGFMPMHTNLVEHEQLVLNGRAKVIIGGKEFEVKKDDVVFIPPGVPHNYKTIGDEAFQFLCLVPNKKDKIKIIEDGES